MTHVIVDLEKSTNAAIIQIEVIFLVVHNIKNLLLFIECPGKVIFGQNPLPNLEKYILF